MQTLRRISVPSKYYMVLSYTSRCVSFYGHKSTAFPTPANGSHNTQRYYVQISNAEFHRNRRINLEITIGTDVFIRTVCQLMPLSLTFDCDIQSKAYFLNSCVKGSLPIQRRSNQVGYLFHDVIFTLKTTN